MYIHLDSGFSRYTPATTRLRRRRDRREHDYGSRLRRQDRVTGPDSLQRLRDHRGRQRDIRRSQQGCRRRRDRRERRLSAPSPASRWSHGTRRPPAIARPSTAATRPTAAATRSAVATTLPAATGPMHAERPAPLTFLSFFFLPTPPGPELSSLL